MKHAFLIIAHDEFDVLRRLIVALDDVRVDFFVHIDAKVKTLPELCARHSKVYFVEKRVDTRWGDYSQIETELSLFALAAGHPGYVFYHLISGVHYPLVSTDAILRHFESHEGRTVFSGLCKDAENQELMKMRHFNLFTRRLGCGSASSRHFFQILWRLSDSLQTKSAFRRFPSLDFFKAANWVSLSYEAMEYLLGHRDEIRRVFRRSFCGDEYFVPTVLLGSPLKDSVVNDDSVLVLFMGPANPRVLDADDFEALKASGCLFARKLSSKSAKSVELMDLIDSRR